MLLLLAYLAVVGWSPRARANWLILAGATFGATAVAVLLEARGSQRSSPPAAGLPVAPAAETVTDARPGRRASVTGLSFDVFVRAKATSDPDDCEDAWAADLAAGRFAVADGASSAFLAREWARSLVEAFVDEPARARTVDSFLRWLRDVRREERGEAGESLDEQPAQPWWEHEARRRGSYATLMGLEVGAAGDDGLREWHAIAVGDTCLVQLRVTSSGPRVIASFPIDSSGAFGASPDLLGSCVERRGDLPPIKSAIGTCESGDVMVLMTDAIAQFGLAAEESSGRAWNGLLDRDPEVNTRTLEAAREAGAIVDDDITILRVRVG